MLLVLLRPVQGKLYTIGGVQTKAVDQYDPETDAWAEFFPSLRHCRVAHGVAADEESICELVRIIITYCTAQPSLGVPYFPAHHQHQYQAVTFACDNKKCFIVRRDGRLCQSKFKLRPRSERGRRALGVAVTADWVQMERCRVTEGLRPEWTLSATMQVTSSNRALLTDP